jgi:RNA polymerase sigma-70 factor (ECF subfamily)
MFTIIKNRFCTNYAARTRESCGSVTDVARYEVADLPPHDWVMRSVDVEKALTRLTSGEREAILLVAAGVSYEEAATTCNCKVGTIKSRVARGRVHLATLLGDKTTGAAISLN